MRFQQPLLTPFRPAWTSLSPAYHIEALAGRRGWGRRRWPAGSLLDFILTADSMPLPTHRAAAKNCGPERTTQDYHACLSSWHAKEPGFQQCDVCSQNTAWMRALQDLRYLKAATIRYKVLTTLEPLHPLGTAVRRESSTPSHACCTHVSCCKQGAFPSLPLRSGTCGAA